MPKARKARIRIPEMTSDSRKAIANSNRGTQNLRKEGYVPSGNRRAEEMVRKGNEPKGAASKGRSINPKVSTTKKKKTISSTMKPKRGITKR